MVTIIIAFFTLAGFNFSFWLLIGLARFLFKKIPHSPKKKRGRKVKPIIPQDVAALIPAHNEELTIERTIRALFRVLPKKNIYVASDYSTDRTVEIAQSLGVNVLDIKPNLGKARALVRTLKHFGLLEMYKAIIINDADAEIDKNYLKLALPYFNDKKIAAVATHGVTRIRDYSFWEKYFIAYRMRLWRVIQIGMRYGQTWKFTNVTFIIPGSLSLYRSSVFWLSTGAFIIELLSYALFILAVPILIILFAVHSFEPISVPFLVRHLTIFDLFVGLFVMDYLITAIAAVLEKRPAILI